MNSLEWIPLLVPEMPSPQEILPYLDRMHLAGKYSNFGPLVAELENRLAEKFSLATIEVSTVANATLGLELVLQALNLSPDAKILIPSFTFVATATAVIRSGYRPVLADVDERSWLMTPDIARSAYKKIKFDAVLTVATLGVPHDMHAWQQFEAETGVPVVIDAAGAYGSQWMQGARGTMVFSLHTTKNLPAGEGGVVVSNKPGLAARVRELSNFGINIKSNNFLPVGVLAGLGTNAKMSEYHAAVALASLDKWDSNAIERLYLHQKIKKTIDFISNGKVLWQENLIDNPVVPSLLCIKMPNEKMREKLEACFFENKITTRRWYQPVLHHMELIKKEAFSLDAPVADDLGRKMLGLPFFLKMDDFHIERIVKSLKKTFQ